MRISSKQIVRLFLWGCGVLLVVLAVSPLLSRDVRFLYRSGFEEALILLKRQSIVKMLEDPNIDEETKRTLELVVDVRNFAEASLGLSALDTYTSYTDVGRDTLLLVLSASPADTLMFYTWWYPVVGTIPYKGFFDHAAAHAEAERLRADGFDTYLRTSGAFSTLGWFDDPLLSTAISSDPTFLAATVIHEVAHNTLYLSDHTQFNESFASFVGYFGAARFFSERGDEFRAGRATGAWRDNIRLNAFYAQLRADLEKIYENGADPGQVTLERERRFDEAREALSSGLGGTLEIYRGEGLARRTLNNASVLAAGIYRSNLDLFERVFELHDHDLNKTVEAISGVLRDATGEPFELLREEFLSGVTP